MILASELSTRSPVQTRTVHVELAERSYGIVIGDGILAQAGTLIARACCGSDDASGRAALIVTDIAVQPLYESIVARSLESAGFQVASIALAEGETHKTLAAVEQIYTRLYGLAADRRTVVVALGGGVVGDIAGFAASSYQRGLDFAQIPTTLLSQVDSSVGGKTGVNYGAAKNLIGAFHQPKLVLIDPATLTTLSNDERRSGMAEIIKYGAIADAALFDVLQRQVKQMLALQSSALADAIARSCEIKARIVEQDERELTGARATLNFGHTVGHALEAVTNYERYRHGEAIAIGMVTACLIGEAQGVTPPAATQALTELLARAGFEIAPDADIPADAVIKLLALDKKSVGGGARFVLLESIGKSSSGHAVPTDIVRAALSRQQELKTG